MATLFISHSWKDKSFTDKLARDLKGVAEIWLDSQQTRPGERIGDDITEGLDRADIVLVVWSRHSAASEWVGKEIAFSTSAGKPVIPLLLDDAPLQGKLEGILGIPVADWESNYAKCFMRVNMAIARKQSTDLAAAGFDLDIDYLFDKLDDLDGVTNYISDYRQQHNLSGNAGQWIERMLTATQAAYAAGSGYLQGLQDGAAYVHALTDRIGESLEDPAGLRKILAEVIANEDRSPLMPTMRATLEHMLSTFPEEAVTPEALPEASGAAPIPAETACAKGIREQIRSAIRLEQQNRILEEHLREVFTHYGIETNEPMLSEARGHVIGYISHAPDLLDALADAAAAKGKSADIQPLLDLVNAYFLERDDLLPDDIGLFGLVDDAYLAFSAIQQANARAREESGMPLVEDDLHAANQMIELLLGPRIVAGLKEKLLAETRRTADWDGWKTLGKVALGGIAAYGVYRMLSNAGGGQGGNASGSNWGNSFEADVSQFFAENGYSSPDWTGSNEY